MVITNLNLNFELPSTGAVVKFKRSYSLNQSYSSSFFPECLLKIENGSFFTKLLLYSGLTDKISIRVDSKFVGSEYILFMNLFNAFFETKTKDSFFVFKTSRFSSLNAASRLLGSIKIELVKKNQFLNFFYFILFFYLPRLSSLGSATQAFSTSVVFPDFSRYAYYFANFTKKYPHYSGVLRKSGLLVFLDDCNISFNLPMSSYILKSTYVTGIDQNEDWSLKFKAYFGSKISIDYFKLQKSFLKFFVAGKQFFSTN